jgi:general secretion pathway protein I
MPATEPVSSRGREAGFSLLEVLIAFAIASMALTALIQLYATSATSARRSVDMVAATQIADNRLAALEDPAELVPGETAGTAEGGYAWRMAIVADDKIVPEDLPLRLYFVTVAVAAPGDARPVLSVTTARTARIETR